MNYIKDLKKKFYIKFKIIICKILFRLIMINST